MTAWYGDVPDELHNELDAHKQDEGEFQLPEAIERALEQSGVPHEKSREISRQIVAIAQFAGPIPHPEILRAYETILPGTAERIFTLAEEQSLYRRSMGKSIVEASIRNQIYGTTCGLIVALAGLASAVVLGLHGQPWVAGVIGSIDLVGLVAVFVIGHKENDNTTPQSDE